MKTNVATVIVQGKQRFVGAVSCNGTVVATSLPCLDRNYASLQGFDVAREVVRTR